jgi:hypothetical protein
MVSIFLINKQDTENKFVFLDFFQRKLNDQYKLIKKQNVTPRIHHHATLLATQFQPNHVSFGFIDAWEFQ